VTRRGTGRRGIVRMSRASYDIVHERLKVAAELLSQYRELRLDGLLQGAEAALDLGRRMFTCYHPDTLVVERELGATREKKASGQ
jgi:hypothetical protein